MEYLAVHLELWEFPLGGPQSGGCWPQASFPDLFFLDFEKDWFEFLDNFSPSDVVFVHKCFSKGWDCINQLFLFLERDGVRVIILDFIYDSAKGRLR